MSIKANLKKYLLSPWFYILFVPVLALSVLLYLDKDNVSQFVYLIPIINVYLTVFISVFSVYAVQSIKEIEWSVKSRACVLFKTIVSANIFCLSSLVVPVIFIAFGCIQKGVPFEIGLNYILFTVFFTAAQIFFLSALGFFLGSFIKNRVAYVAAVLLSAVFTPFVQLFFLDDRKNYHNDTLRAFFDLINLSLDDPSRIKYVGYGMPINIENILSWIITILCGLFLILILFAAKRCFKIKGMAVLGVLSLLTVFSAVGCTELYFNASPVLLDYSFSSDTPPAKVDTAHIYSDDSSPVITRYNMNLYTGTVVKNVCEFELNINNNSAVKLRLDECFKIRSLTINGENADYSRDGDYFTVSLNPVDEKAVIKAEYSGRMNYTDLLGNKVDVCDINGGFLSEMFAWYPKLLSSENVGQSKDFTIEINAVNRFVTNLDGYTVHPSGKQTVSGKKRDILFYLGYIGEIEYADSKLVIPLEYQGYSKGLDRLKRFLTETVSGESVTPSYENTIIEYDAPQFRDFYKTPNTLMSFEELNAYLNNWYEEMEATDEQRQSVAPLLKEIEKYWNDSLIEIEESQDPKKLERPEYKALDNLLFGLWEVWDYQTKRLSSEELQNLNTVVVIPYSYNVSGDLYVFDGGLIVTEGMLS